MEITSLNGTITESAIHIHATLADKNFQTVGGHLKEAIVGGTCEIYLEQIKATLERKADAETGLNLIDL